MECVARAQTRAGRSGRSAFPSRRGGACGLALLVALACAPAAAPAGPSTTAPAAASTGAGSPSAAPTRAPAPLALRVAYASQGATNTPVWVAQDRGLFREQGLDVELVLLPGVRADQGVITGDTPIGFGANVIATRLSGADISGVAGLVTAMSFTLFARPGSGIQGPADLRGRTLVSTSPGGANSLAVLLMLRHLGLEPGRDVSIQPTPGTVEQLAIMTQGLADAATFSPPASLKAQELGLVPVMKLSDLNIPFLLGMVATSQSYARDHAEEVRRFLRSYVQAVATARAEPDATKAILGKYTDTDEPAVLDEAYLYYRDLWGRPDFRVSPAAVRSVLSVVDVPGAATAQPDDFVDNRFIDELDRSGFIRQSGALD